MKELKKLKINKIAFCVDSTPANRFDCLVKKSEENMEKLIKAAEKVWADDFNSREFSELTPDSEELEDCIKEVGLYSDSLPDKLKNSLDIVIAYAVRGYEVENEEEDEDGNGNGKDKKKVNKSEEEEDKFPSFVIPKLGLIQVVKDDEEDDPDEDYLPESVIKRLRKLEAKAGNQEKDLYPSFPMPVTHTQLMKMLEEEEEEEEDADYVEVPRKKSIDSQEGLRIEKVEKDDDDFDEKFPSLSAMFTTSLGIE